MPARVAKPKTVDEYLASVPADQRAALERLRTTIKEIVPDATEAISYGMPAFKHHGGLVGYAAFKDHLSFFPMSGTLLDRYGEEVSHYRASKGTLQFTVDDPIPDELVRRIVRDRIAENEGRRRP